MPTNLEVIRARMEKLLRQRLALLAEFSREGAPTMLLVEQVLELVDTALLLQPELVEDRLAQTRFMLHRLRSDRTLHQEAEVTDEPETK